MLCATGCAACLDDGPDSMKHPWYTLCSLRSARVVESTRFAHGVLDSTFTKGCCGDAECRSDVESKDADCSADEQQQVAESLNVRPWTEKDRRGHNFAGNKVTESKQRARANWLKIAR